MSIKCGKCKGHHETVNGVRNCYLGTNFDETKTAAGLPAQSQPTLDADLPSGSKAFLEDRPKPARSPRANPVTEDGMYRLKDAIYKVQRAVHGSGRLYAKKLTQQPDGSWKFEYAPGAIKLLTSDDKLTLEQAQEFGHLYGVCCSCGAVLTNEESIELGIGPVCRGKWF